MKILYFSWTEIIGNDVLETLRGLGHTVKFISYSVSNLLLDKELDALMEQELESASYDCMISTNFLPVLAKVSFRHKLSYISWIYDSPCLTLYSEMVYSPYSYVFHFDSAEVERLRLRGVKNVWHMPLAVNINRISKLISEIPENVETTSNFSGLEVSFMGNLYSEALDFPDNINGIGDYEKGFVKALVDSQLRIMGCDIMGEMLPTPAMEEIARHIELQLEPELCITRQDILLNMLRKKASAVERMELLEIISKKFKVTLFSQSDVAGLSNVEKRGYIDYRSQMPIMFNQSKINLNITLRCIQSGISLRAMDIMGAGGFLLSNWQPELAQLFDDGKDMVMYYDRQDLINKVDYYLKHDEERVQIANNGFKKIAAEYTYEKAWAKIFELVGLS